jgi:hypothetical protein
VILASNRDSIAFDARGFTTVITPSPRFIVKVGTAADTVCITGFGVASTRTCP